MMSLLIDTSWLRSLRVVDLTQSLQSLQEISDKHNVQKTYQIDPLLIPLSITIEPNKYTTYFLF